MTLEVLANSVPSGPSSKAGGRTAGENEEGADAFSTALSKAGREHSSGDRAEGEEHHASSPASRGMDDMPLVEPLRRSVKDVLPQAGNRVASEKVQHADTSAPTAPPVEENVLPGRDKADPKAVDEGEAAPEAQHEDEKDVATAPSSDAQDATDLLSILTGLPVSATAAGAAEGRRTAAGTAGEPARKGAVDAASKGRAEADTPSDAVELPPVDDPAKPQDVNLRFINAKNGSLNAELTLAAQSRDQGSSEARAAGPQVETVMVMDSRRFIGMQGGSNSASLMAAMVGDQAWSSAMQPDSALSNIASQSSSGSVVHMLKLQMTPHDLGTVTATLKMNGDQLHVHLAVETRAAHQQLSEDSSGMIDALRSQGFSVDQVTVSITPSSEADPQKGQQGSQTGQQQMAGNGERQGGLNRDQSGQRFGSAADNRNFENDIQPDPSAAAATDGAVGARSGQLYL